MFNFYYFFFKWKELIYFSWIIFACIYIHVDKKKKKSSAQPQLRWFFFWGVGESEGASYIRRYITSIGTNVLSQHRVPPSCSLLAPLVWFFLVVFGGVFFAMITSDHSKTFARRGYRKTWRGPPDAASRNQIFHLENSSWTGWIWGWGSK